MHPIRLYTRAARHGDTHLGLGRKAQVAEGAAVQRHEVRPALARGHRAGARLAGVDQRQLAESEPAVQEAWRWLLRGRVSVSVMTHMRSGGKGRQTCL